MKNTFLLIIISTLLIGLIACSSSEDKAQIRFNEIEQQGQAGQTAETQANYRQLIRDYPATKGAIKAQQRLSLLLEKKLATEMQQAYVAIKSIPRIISGYKSVYRHWPQSIKDFDDGDYFFDSSYMLETIPQGFTAYLALTADEGGFILWSLPEGSDSSYRMTDNGKKVLREQKATLLAEIDRNYRIEADHGALIVLLPKTAN